MGYTFNEEVEGILNNIPNMCDLIFHVFDYEVLVERSYPFKRFAFAYDLAQEYNEAIDYGYTGDDIAVSVALGVLRAAALYVSEHEHLDEETAETLNDWSEASIDAIVEVLY